MTQRAEIFSPGEPQPLSEQAVASILLEVFQNPSVIGKEPYLLIASVLGSDRRSNQIAVELFHKMEAFGLVKLSTIDDKLSPRHILPIRQDLMDDNDEPPFNPQIGGGYGTSLGIGLIASVDHLKIDNYRKKTLPHLSTQIIDEPPKKISLYNARRR